MYLAYCDKALDVSVRIWETKYVSAVLQINIAPMVTQPIFDGVCRSWTTKNIPKGEKGANKPQV